MLDILKGNADARNALTARFLGADTSTPQPKQLSAAEAQDALNGWVYKQPGMATAEDCVAWAKRVGKAHKHEGLIALMQRFGIPGMGVTIETFKNDLWIGQWQAFVDYAMTSVYYGLDPRDPWTVKVYEAKGDTLRYLTPYVPDGISHDAIESFRTRWLLYHAESDCLFTVDSRSSAEKVMEHSGEDILDVTGIESREAEFEAKDSGEL